MEMQKKELVSLTERNQEVSQRCWSFTGPVKNGEAFDNLNLVPFNDIP